MYNIFLGIKISEMIAEAFSRYTNMFDRYFKDASKKRREKSKTGWVRLHYKVIPEKINDYTKTKKNIHYRKHIKLNRWWWNEK